MQLVLNKKTFVTHCLTALLCVMPVSVFADDTEKDPAQALSSVLKSYERFSADFEQITRSDQSSESEISKGEMQIERPGKFRWETNTPFPQLIVSDGDNVWIYDPDLEQATRKPVNLEDTNGAALILNGNIEELQEKFDISMPVSDAGSQLFDLQPKDNQSSFQRIRIYFSNGVMSELMLQDVLGQQTTIVLHNSSINPAFSDTLFEFTPPEGVDVIISDQM
ncbi:outer membrane lipoprotein chaperone LolA [Neptunomonas phycophila]|jgi:outer membrane lipoprotein carrier protein|uniref:outer membrane lipoprotein chaperone LolA n=1 Tax=Neptunomonas TaxID=75687 RepID=UPI0023F8E6B7|nr:outer membrane lipoprotein chaperone LolA [Neptunomonas phycophila]